MKRFFCAILTVLSVMAFFSATAHADTHPNDPAPDFSAILGWKKDFSYQEDTGNWQYESCYEESNEDFLVRIGFHAMSVDGGDAVKGTGLFVQTADMRNQELDIPVSIKMTIDGDCFEIPNLIAEGSMSGIATLGENYNLLVEALAYGSADNVNVEVSSAKNTYSFTCNPILLTATLKDFCRTYAEEHFWQYTVGKEWYLASEEMYPFYVNGVPANYQEMHKYTSNADRTPEIERLKYPGLELGMTREQVHAILGETDSFTHDDYIMDIYLVGYDKRPVALDPMGKCKSLFEDCNLIVSYKSVNGLYIVISYGFGCGAEGDPAVIKEAIYPIFDFLNYATALFGPAEESVFETSHQYFWWLEGQRFRLNVDFIAKSDEVESIIVSTGWGVENA